MVFRIGQRIGLHRESDSARLPVLDSEMRRRLWWQVSILDARGTERSEVGASVFDVEMSQRLWWQKNDLGAHNTEHSGVGPSVVAENWATSRPLNVNDSDLKPGMTIPPLNHVGATEMLFPLMMYEVGAFLRHSKSMAAFDGSWHKLCGYAVPIADKDKVINELEDILESKFLRHCDPVIPLHILVKAAWKVVCGRMRLTTRHPRRYPDRGTSMSRNEKMELFFICLMMVEQDNILYSTPSVRGFLWHMDLQSQLDAIVYMLSELRLQSTGDTADRAWTQIAEAFAHHPHMITNTKNPLFAAVRRLTLKSWEARETEYAKQNFSPPEGSSPLFISQIRSQRANNALGHLHGEAAYNMTVPATGQSSSRLLSEGLDNNFDSSLDLDSIPSDLGEMDWNYWNDLMQGTESSTMMTYGAQEVYDQNSTLFYAPG